MARREVTHFFDDLDNTPLTEDEVHVIRFSIGGADYILDLSLENARDFHSKLAPFIKAARRAPSAHTRRPGILPTYNPRAVRLWAKENGYHVSPRGKISQNVVEAYLSDHPGGR